MLRRRTFGLEIAHALPDGSRYNRDNVAATLSFLDGSIASLIYVANGDKSVPKEHFEVFCEGGIGIINDFCALELSRDGKTVSKKSRRDLSGLLPGREK